MFIINKNDRNRQEKSIILAKRFNGRLEDYYSLAIISTFFHIFLLFCHFKIILPMIINAFQ